jgi:hypothetical protein
MPDSGIMQGADAGGVQAPKLRPTRPTGLDQGAIEREIAGGLSNQIGRMRDAYECMRYGQARFEEFPTRHKDRRYRSPSVRRTIPIMQRIMKVLCMHLYKAQPTRKLGPDPSVSEWLERVYRRNKMWAKWRRADQLTLTGGFAGFQFAGSTDPNAPLKINLWGAESLAYWTHPEDATKVEAVATCDFQDNQRTLTLWTREQIVTYRTTKGATHSAFGGTAFRLEGVGGKPARRPNPYRDRKGVGIIPFSFVHWDYPVSDFETNSPGLNLKQLNEGINERLDNLGDSIYFNCKPIGVAIGVDDGWSAPAELRPGDFIKLPADSIDLGGNGPQPTLAYLMPDLSYVSKDWEDQSAFLDNTLEAWGIPPSLIRMVQSGAKSGLAIQSEQLPILGWVEGRRADFAAYEEDAAERGLQVAESHLRNAGLSGDADLIQRVLDDWSFSLRWPSLYIQLPGPDRDRADDWRLSRSQVSLVGILQERQDLTEDEAFEAIGKVAQQNARLRAMGINPNPADPFGGGGLPQPGPQPGLPAPEGDDLGAGEGPDGGADGAQGSEDGDDAGRDADTDFDGGL